jgi:hypothetical protein
MKKIVLVIGLVSMLFQIQVAQAQALPFLSTVFNGTINRAIGAGILSNLARRGITVAANDAVFAETMSFVGKAANDASYVSTAAGVAATVLGAPVWLSAAISVGALAAAGGVAWGLYQLTQTGTGLSTQLTLTPTNPVSTPLPVAAPAGSWTAYTSPGCNPAITTVCGAHPALPSTLQYYDSGYPNSGSVIGCISIIDCATQRLAAEISFESTVMSNVQGSVSVQPPGCLGDGCAYSLMLTWTPLPSDPTVTGENVPVFPSINPAYVTPIKTTTGTLSSLPITADMLAAPLPQSLTASLADSLWRNAAAQPGYDGYPYSPMLRPPRCRRLGMMRSKGFRVRWDRRLCRYRSTRSRIRPIHPVRRILRVAARGRVQRKTLACWSLTLPHVLRWGPRQLLLRFQLVPRPLGCRPCRWVHRTAFVRLRSI